MFSAPRKLKATVITMLFPRASERRVLPIVGVCKTPSHLHILSSHLLIFTFSHPHIFSSSSYLHIFSSSHLLTSSHIFSHLLTSSHIFSHLLTSSHIFSHLLIFSSHIFSSCPLALLPLPSCPLALSFFSISLLKAGAGAVPTRRHETQPFRTK